MKTMSIIILGLLFLVQPSQALCQEATRDSISFEKKMMGTVFKCKGEKLSRSDLHALLSQEPRAAEELASAKWREATATVFAVAGGALIGWPIGTAIGGNEDPNWTMAYVGGGCVIVGLLFASSSDGHYRNAVNAYNGEVRLGFLSSGIPIRFCILSKGVGLSASF